jgi:hypothetical protein
VINDLLTVYNSSNTQQQSIPIIPSLQSIDIKQSSQIPSLYGIRQAPPGISPSIMDSLNKGIPTFAVQTYPPSISTAPSSSSASTQTTSTTPNPPTNVVTGASQTIATSYNF